MKHVIRVVSMTALLLGATSAVAEDVSLEEVDTRTEAQQAEDALQEAQDNAAIDSLMASTASAPATVADDAAEAVTSSPSAPANEYTEAQALEFLQNAEPEAVASMLSTPPVQLRGCWYFIYATPSFGWGPPRYQLTVQRMPSRHCDAQTAVLDSSYTAGIHVATKESEGIAISFTSKQSPSGSALVHVRLFAVDPKTLAVDRYGFLGTYRGSTYVNAMHFEGNRLLVDTNRYTATYPRFLTSEESPLGVIFP